MVERTKGKNVQPKENVQPLTCSVAAAIQMTGLSQATIYRMIDRNELASVKIGGRRLVRVDSIRKLVGADEPEAAAAA